MLSLLSIGRIHHKSIAATIAAIAAIIVMVAPLSCFGATESASNDRRTPANTGKREAESVSIHLPKKPGAITKRVADILASRIQEYSGASVVRSGYAGLTIYLEIRPGIGQEGFKISDRPGGGISITGNDERGLLYGVGKFLRTSSYSSRGFSPGSWRGVSVPSKPVRGIYFATHFHNYYHEAPIEEVTRYVEDLSLWGLNSFCVWFDMHHFNGLDDPNAQAMLVRLRALLKTAKDLGLSTTLATVANEGYANSPVNLRADDSTQNGNRIYNLGPELCPNKPGAMELELSWYEQKFSEFKSVGVDYMWIWPYDNGGCTCSKCAPWGINGFLSMAEPEARAYRRSFPNGKVILSTWYFDRWAYGEWEGITNKFNAQKPDWVDYIMADDYGGKFPQYPLTHGSPGGLPMLNFPEISMYLHSPWGGYGAIPLPKYLQSLWNVTKSKLSGGFPYSEGIYEDINKAMCAQLYWNPDKPTQETVREYIAYYFSPSVVDSVSTALNTLEQNLERWRDDSNGVTKVVMKTTQGAEEAYQLVAEADKQLPARVRMSWRWRVIYLRALIDSELVKHQFRVSEECAAAFRELTTIYHAEHGEGMVSPPTGILGVVHDKVTRSMMNGLLVRAWGRVAARSADGSGFYIDDGSRTALRVELSGLNQPIGEVPDIEQYVAVTGVVSGFTSDPYNAGVTLRPRGDVDITVLLE